MRNNVLARTFRMMFSREETYLSPQEEPAPFGSQRRKPPSAAEVRVQGAIQAIEAERHRLRSDTTGKSYVAEISESDGDAFIAGLDEIIYLANKTQATRRDMEFVMALRRRVEPLYANGDADLGDIVQINNRMVENEGWRMGNLDRYLMSHARQVCEAWRPEPSGMDKKTSEVKHDSQTVMLESPVTDYRERSAEPAPTSRSQVAGREITDMENESSKARINQQSPGM